MMMNNLAFPVQRVFWLILFLLVVLLPHKTFSDDFRFSADSMSTRLREGEKKTFLEGSARIETETTVIEAEQIEMFGPEFRYAQASSEVIIIDEEQGLKITAQNLYFDRERDYARIRGNAILTDSRNGVIVKGGFMENRDSDKMTTIQSRVRIFKDDIVARSEFALYRREEEILELSGMPQVYKGEDEYRASRIIINLKTDEISLLGGVTGEVLSQEESQEESQE